MRKEKGLSREQEIHLTYQSRAISYSVSRYAALKIFALVPSAKFFKSQVEPSRAASRFGHAVDIEAEVTARENSGFR